MNAVVHELWPYLMLVLLGYSAERSMALRSAWCWRAG